MFDQRSNSKIPRNSKIRLYRIYKDRIVMSTAKASPCKPVLQPPSRAGPKIYSFVDPSEPTRRNSARSYARALLGVPHARPQTPQYYAYVSRKTCLRARPRPWRLPDVCIACDTCESHETMADVMACLAQQRPLECMPAPATPETSERASCFSIETVESSPRSTPSLRRSSTGGSSVEENIRFYNSLSQQDQYGDRSLFRAESATFTSSPDCQNVINSVSDNQTLARPTLMPLATPEAEAVTETKTHSDARRTQVRTASTSNKDQVGSPSLQTVSSQKSPPSKQGSVTENLRQRPGALGRKVWARKGAVSRIGTPPQSVDYFHFPTMASEGSCASSYSGSDTRRRRSSISSSSCCINTASTIPAPLPHSSRSVCTAHSTSSAPVFSEQVKHEESLNGLGIYISNTTQEPHSIPIEHCSDDTDRFSNYEWGHLEKPSFLDSAASPHYPSVANTALSSAAEEYASSISTTSSFVVEPVADPVSDHRSVSSSISSALDSGDEHSSRVEHERQHAAKETDVSLDPGSLCSEENWCPPCFSILMGDNAPTASWLTKHAAQCMQKSRECVDGWMRHASFSEGPELWHETQQQHTILTHRQSLSGEPYCSNESSCDTVTPGSSVSVRGAPREYQPSHRWRSNSRILFGSDASERPLPVPAQYAARAHAESQRRKPMPRVQASTNSRWRSTFNDQRPTPVPMSGIQQSINDTSVKTSSTFKNPRPAPVPPCQSQIRSKMRSGHTSIPAIRDSSANSFADPKVIRYQLTHQLPVNVCGAEIPFSRFSASTDSSADSSLIVSPVSPSTTSPVQSSGSQTPSDVVSRDNESIEGPIYHFDNFTSALTNNSIATSSASSQSTAPSLTSVPPPPLQRKRVPAPEPTSTPQPPCFVDSSVASAASRDTLDDLVDDLADDVDKQLRDGRELARIVRQWEDLSDQIAATTDLAPSFRAMLEALKEQLAEELAQNQAHEISSTHAANVKSTWGIRTDARNWALVQQQLLEEEIAKKC